MCPEAMRVRTEIILCDILSKPKSFKLTVATVGPLRFLLNQRREGEVVQSAVTSKKSFSVKIWGGDPEFSTCYNDHENRRLFTGSLMENLIRLEALFLLNNPVNSPACLSKIV